jgi:energy-coupling factor transporter ATP-binding protein EcfA2
VENKSSTILPINVDALHALLKEPQFKQIQVEAKDKKLGLFLGLTGAGKSTCISYLLGGTLQKVRGTGGRSQVILSPTQNEVSAKKYPTIGMSDYCSQTLHSEVFCDPHLDMAYCDTAGFMDTRTIGSAKEIYASFSVQLAVESAACVSTIFIVVEWSIFTSPTCNDLYGFLDLLGQFLIEPAQHADAIFFLINKIPDDVTPEDFYELVSVYQRSLLDTQAKYQDIQTNPQMTPPPSSLEDVIRMIGLFDAQIKKRPEQVIFMDLLDNGKTRETIHALLRKKTSVIPKESFNFRKYNAKRTLFERNIETILPQLQAKDAILHKKAEAARVLETVPTAKPLETLSNPLPEDKHTKVDLDIHSDTPACVATSQIADDPLSTNGEFSIKSEPSIIQNPVEESVTPLLIKLVETAGPVLLVEEDKIHIPEANNKILVEPIFSTEPLKKSPTAVSHSPDTSSSKTNLEHLLLRGCFQILGLGFGVLTIFLLTMGIGLLAHEPPFITLAQALFATTVEPILAAQALTGMLLSLITTVIFFSVATFFTQDSQHKPLTVEDGLQDNPSQPMRSSQCPPQNKSFGHPAHPIKNPAPVGNPTLPVYQTRVLGKNL